MDDGGDCRRPDSVHKRKGTEMGNQLEEQEQDTQQGGCVKSACVIQGSKHVDGSIYRQDAHFCHRLYRLDDIRETRLKPTNLSSLNSKDCWPNWAACRRHNGCAMMQIFSLKLANYSTNIPAGPIQLYGFMAVRDLLEPLRNYVFNRTRDDPLIHYPSSDDPSAPLLILMASPKRGIYLQARALIEFDMWIKRGPTTREDEDLHLIDGAATFSELTAFHGVHTQRIHGDHGAVDTSLALLRRAVEARIQVGVPELPANGLRLSLGCFVSGLPQEIKLFDGIVDKPGDLMNGFVVAVVINSPLILDFKVSEVGGSPHLIRRLCAFPAKPHGGSQQSVSLDIAAAEVQVSWANLENN